MYRRNEGEWIKESEKSKERWEDIEWKGAQRSGSKSCLLYEDGKT
jgi:hypothetical protein